MSELIQSSLRVNAQLSTVARSLGRAVSKSGASQSWVLQVWPEMAPVSVPARVPAADFALSFVVHVSLDGGLSSIPFFGSQLISSSLSVSPGARGVRLPLWARSVDVLLSATTATVEYAVQALVAPGLLSPSPMLAQLRAADGTSYALPRFSTEYRVRDFGPGAVGTHSFVDPAGAACTGATALPNAAAGDWSPMPLEASLLSFAGSDAVVAEFR